MLARFFKKIRKIISKRDNNVDSEKISKTSTDNHIEGIPEIISSHESTIQIEHKQIPKQKPIIMARKPTISQVEKQNDFNKLRIWANAIGVSGKGKKEELRANILEALTAPPKTIDQNLAEKKAELAKQIGLQAGKAKQEDDPVTIGDNLAVVAVTMTEKIREASATTLSEIRGVLNTSLPKEVKYDIEDKGPDPANTVNSRVKVRLIGSPTKSIVIPMGEDEYFRIAQA